MFVARVLLERDHGRRIRGKAGEVVREPAHLAGRGGVARGHEPFGVEPRLDEAIDVGSDGGRIGGDRGHGRILDGFPRPVALVLGAVVDPAAEDLDLGRGQRLPRRGHRIEVVGDPFDEQAGVRIARHDRRIATGPHRLDGTLADVEPQAALPGGLVGPVTGEAAGDEDRSNVAIEVDARVGGGNARMDRIVRDPVVGAVGGRRPENARRERCHRRRGEHRRSHSTDLRSTVRHPSTIEVADAIKKSAR